MDLNTLYIQVKQLKYESSELLRKIRKWERESVKPRPKQ